MATSVLPTPVGPEKRKRADRLVGLAQARARHLDRCGQRLDRRVLAEHDALQVAVQILQLGAVVARHRLRRDARDLGDDLLDFVLADRLLLLRLRQDALRGAGLVDDVDRLVGQVAVVDELGGQLGRRVIAPEAYLTPWCSSKRDFRPFRISIVCCDRRLDDVDLLEATRQRLVFLEDAAVLVEGGRADALQRAARQRGLQQVGRIERSARGRAGADQRVDFVDEEDRVRIVLQLLEHPLQPLLEVAAVLGAGQQRAHVERVDARLVEDLRHVALDDAPRQAFGDRGLADAGLADQQRVVLAPAAQHLDHALDLGLAPDQRIDLAVLGERVEVLRELLERRRLVLAFAFLLLLRRGFGLFFRPGRTS